MCATEENGPARQASPRWRERYGFATVMIAVMFSALIGGPGYVTCRERASVLDRGAQLVGPTTGKNLAEVIAEHGPPDIAPDTPLTWTWFGRQPDLPEATRQIAVYHVDHTSTVAVLFIDAHKIVIGATTLDSG